jgi:hypothetical protein
MDTFRFDDQHAGDATFGPASDVILDLGLGDVIDLLAVDILHYDGSIEPLRGGLSLTEGADGSTYITWNTFGAFRDVEVRGVTDLYDLYWNHIRWYEDDNYGGFETTVRIAAGDTRIGTIENRYDEDWWRIDVTAEHLYTFDLASMTGARPALEYLSLTLFDANGQWIVGDWGNRTNPVEVEFYAEASGTYYLQAWNDFSGRAGSYRLDVAATPYSDDYGRWNEADRGEVAVGGSTTGAIGHQGDEDAFAFAVEDGRTYTIDVEGASSAEGTLVDPYAFVYNASGDWIADDYDGGDGENARIVFTASENATYTVTVSDEFTGETGTYRVSLTDELLV